MGFTSIEVMKLLKSYIVRSLLMTDVKKPNGKLCDDERPLNSELEDVTINGLALVKDDVDEAVLNVNIYVPNLKFPKDPADKSQPNTARLTELSKLGNKAFLDGEEIWDDAGEYCFKYQQDTVMKDENNQRYLNFRIEFYS